MNQMKKNTQVQQKQLNCSAIENNGKIEKNDRKDTGPVSVDRSAKELFKDCALIEIIHLHDCLRGALRALKDDITELNDVAQMLSMPQKEAETGVETAMASWKNLSELERLVKGRFQVIWSVFRTHSAAEDKFIWPALRRKLTNFSSPCCSRRKTLESIDQGEYEEDHADEEQMFSEMNGLLTRLHDKLKLIKEEEGESPQNKMILTSVSKTSISTDCSLFPSISSSSTAIPLQEECCCSNDKNVDIRKLANNLKELACKMNHHLLEHLQKEEESCMPLVHQHLNKEEINELMGNIMGRRSSDTMGQILNLAVQTLPVEERREMVQYMKQAMVGTFFERWLGHWSVALPDGCDRPRKRSMDGNDLWSKNNVHVICDTSSEDGSEEKADKIKDDTLASMGYECFTQGGKSIKTQADLEKLIRAVATNATLTASQKNCTIQGLRDSVFKNNANRKRKVTELTTGSSSVPFNQRHCTSDSRVTAPVGTNDALHPTSSSCRNRITAPNLYYKETAEGNVVLVHDSNDSLSAAINTSADNSVPLFSASELAPTFHDGANGAVLGCPHYARSCKVRHPSSGRLYTCRLCCEQEREMPLRDQDSPLDRFKVEEVLCMRCGTLQPSSNRCVNSKCGKPFANYVCKICNLFDDGQHKSIYHCPFCNVCRSGLGLGIDFRHCMRCNACVSLKDNNHVCITQRLQGNCPICHESMFESTEPLRGLKCGHVMHLSCFNLYMRSQTYTCPLCKKSVDDMKEYFSQLDAAIRMQPMPPAYANVTSKIHCQDCGKLGEVNYHFVGCKCTFCGSYNTRELERRPQNN